MTQVHAKPPPIPLIKGKCDGKSDKDFEKMKLRRHPTSSTLELYEFKMSLFENDDPEESLLFLRNFNTTIAVPGMLETDAKVQYLRALNRGEELRQFESFF